jgi:hypothetical protein
MTSVLIVGSPWSVGRFALGGLAGYLRCLNRINAEAVPMPVWLVGDPGKTLIHKKEKIAVPEVSGSDPALT